MKEHGLLLVNLGSPATPTAPAVKQYLREFLGDPNVVTMPRWLWRPILNGLILPIRSPRSAALYQDIWLAEGSPLIVYTKRLTKLVQDLLPAWDVRMAMTYGEPAIGPTLRQMKQSCRQVAVLSLFPHYTQSTTDTIVQQVRAVDPTIPVIDRFADEPAFLDLLAARINSAWNASDYEMLFISYHGIPASMVKAGDPYQEETQRTTAELRKRLVMAPRQIKMVYQSKFGPLPWLQPYLQRTLVQEAQRRLKKALVVSPSFVADCLETLEENGVQNQQTFLANGGDKLTVLPSFNDHPQFARFLADLAQRSVAESSF